ncbi:MAG: hypothetical protein V3S39_02970 [Thermodesulfobacteriota bacterium]
MEPAVVIFIADAINIDLRGSSLIAEDDMGKDFPPNLIISKLQRISRGRLRRKATQRPQSPKVKSSRGLRPLHIDAELIGIHRASCK